jgi:hypothetical protein
VSRRTGTPETHAGGPVMLASARAASGLLVTLGHASEDVPADLEPLDLLASMARDQTKGRWSMARGATGDAESHLRYKRLDGLAPR